MSQPPEPPGVGQKLAPYALVLVLYATLAALMTYPLVTRLTIMEPGDTAYFSWAMGWTLHSLVTDPASLAHGNVYHPSRFALGMDEPIIGSSILMLPLWLLVDDAVLLLNLLRLTIFTLCGFGGYLLARQLGSSYGPAVFAGAAFAFSPMRIDQIGHLSTLGAQWLPLTLLFMHRFSLRGRLRDAWLAAGFFLLAGYACGYHGLMGLVLLPFFALALLWNRWRLLPGAVAATIVVALGFLPLRALHAGAFEEHGFERGREETLMYSASLESFVATSSWNRIYGSLTEPFRDAAAGYLFPGLIVPGLVLLGAYRLFQTRRRPSRIAVALGLLAIAAAFLALGPEIRAGGRTLMPGPFSLLREDVPIFQLIRVNNRASVFIALALPLLAARALEPLAKKPIRLAVLGALLLGESWIAPIPIPDWQNVIDTRESPPPVYTWLAEQPGDFPIVELPMLPDDGRFERPAFHESVYMVYSTLHWKRIVNGYAGVDPKPHRDLEPLLRRFPSQASLAALRAIGVRYVVLHWRPFGPNRTRRMRRDLPLFSDDLRVVADFGDDVVFEIVAPRQRTAASR